MFDQIERQVLPSNDLYGPVSRISQALFQEGQVALAQVSATSWVGKGPEVGMGFVIKATVIGYPGSVGAALDIKLEAELEDKGIALLYASWVVCLPIAPFLFAYAWHDATTRKKALFQAAWAAAMSGGFGPAGPAWAPQPPAW